MAPSLTKKRPLVVPIATARWSTALARNFEGVTKVTGRVCTRSGRSRWIEPEILVKP